MNLYKQSNAFYDWLETNPLATSGIVLWHALMHIANKAGWPDKFAVAVSVLKVKTGLEKDAIYTARNKLQQLGRIRWESRKGNQSAIYEIIPFYFDSDKPTQIPTQLPTINNCIGLADTNANSTPTQIPTQLPTINILDNTKQDSVIITPAREDEKIFQEIVLAVQQIKPITNIKEHQLISDMVNNYPKDWILGAIEITLGKENRVFSLKFIDGVLINWRKAGFKDEDKPWEVDVNVKSGTGKGGFSGNGRAYARTRPKSPSQADWENEPEYF